MRVPRGVRAGRLGPAVNSIRRKRLRREGGAVVVDPPINVVLPSITGSTIEGETLTGVEGTWTGDDIVFSYAWLRDGDPISGADEVTYTLVADDVGADIVLRVTATNDGGAVSADSAAVGPVDPFPLSLFANSEPGFFLTANPDTCFTDTAGTTNAGPGDAVAYWKDLSGRNNHATQATLASRPILGRKPEGGRRNILRQTATLATQTRVVTAAQHTLSFRGTGTVTLTGASAAGPLVGTGANDIVSLTFTPTAGNLTLTVSGTVNDAQLELGAVRTAYQLVADAGGFDVTEAGKPDRHYLFFGGNADPRWMQTPTITPGTDKVQVFAGMRKFDNTAGSLVRFGDPNSQTGSFEILSSGWLNFANRYGSAIRQTAIARQETSPNFAPPRSDVLAWRYDFGGATRADEAKLRVSGVEQTLSIFDAVQSGNFLAYPTFIGARAGTGLFFNGEISTLTARFGPNLTTEQIEDMEAFTASKVAEDTI